LSYNDAAKQDEVLRKQAEDAKAELEVASRGMKKAEDAEKASQQVIESKNVEINDLKEKLTSLEAERAHYQGFKENQVKETTQGMAMDAQEAQRELERRARELEGSLNAALSKNRVYAMKLTELGVDTRRLDQDVGSEAAPVLQSIDSNTKKASSGEFEVKLESLRASLKSKKDMLHTRLNNARALTDKLKNTLEQSPAPLTTQ